MVNNGRSFETTFGKYEESFGPAYYSMNVGNIHYVFWMITSMWEESIFILAISMKNSLHGLKRSFIYKGGIDCSAGDAYPNHYKHRRQEKVQL